MITINLSKNFIETISESVMENWKLETNDKKINTFKYRMNWNYQTKIKENHYNK